MLLLLYDIYKDPTHIQIMAVLCSVTALEQRVDSDIQQTRTMKAKVHKQEEPHTLCTVPESTVYHCVYFK